VAQQDSIVSGMAGRYALALFELAKEQKSVDRVSADLKTFGDLIAANPDMQRLVRSPVFSAPDQVKAITAVLDKAGIAGVAANFLKLVASKRRLFSVQDMIRVFNTLVDQENGVTRAEVTVAEPLNDANLAALKDALASVSGGKSIDLAVKIDPAIIGGLVVKLGSRMVDGSLKTKLNSIRTRMKEVG
jgi:F-type H+-transporting ATPase subunit delta